MNASSHFASHWKAFFRTWKKGWHLSLALDTNRLKAAILPVRRWTSFIPDGDGIVDSTRSTGRRDSLLKWKENVKRKCGLIFEFWKIRPKGGTVLLWSRHLLLSLFLNGENQVRTKNPNDSSMEKKRSAKTKFLGPGIRLPIRKVLHMR